MSEENKNVVNLFDMEVNDSTMSFLEKKISSRDGIYKPELKDAKDKSKGYAATIRFLPNVLDDMTLGPSAIENHVHYAKLPDYPDLQGYYDSLINFGEKCPLTTLYWKLKNSKNQAEVERAELISRTSKYYSYVLIIEDENHPELEGKILIYQYGFNIKEKINLERTGEVTGKKCNVFDPANGKDFRLIIKEVGGFNNYNSSSFRQTSPLKIWDADKKTFKETPVEWSEEKGKFLITNPKVQKVVFNFLKDRDESVNLNEYVATPWTDEIKSKVEKIIEILSGNDVSIAKTKIKSNATSTNSTDTIEDSDFEDNNDGEDLDDFFGSVEN